MICRRAGSGSSYAPCESTSSTSMFAIRHSAAVLLLFRLQVSFVEPLRQAFEFVRHGRDEGASGRDAVPCKPIGRIPAVLQLSTISQPRLGEEKLYTCNACDRHCGAGRIPVRSH
jgi:hypothetical protein